MTREELLTEVRKAFGERRRPGSFIPGTCRCEECLEHDQDMRSFVPDDLPLEKLDNPGWDPICFASDEAFAYLMPGLVKLVLDHTDDYVWSFVNHVNEHDRVRALSESERRALVDLLDFLVLHEAAALDNNLAADDLFAARGMLEGR